MSDMSATVILKMVDDLTAPARRAHKSLETLQKDLQKLKGFSFKSTGITKSIDGIVRETKKAVAETSRLRQAMGRPVPDAFGKAATGIEKVKRQANDAARAVGQLESRLRRGGNFSGGARGGFRSSGGRGWGGSSHGGGHGVGALVKSAAIHTTVYETISEAFAGAKEAIKSGMEQAFDARHTAVMLKMQGETDKDISAAIAQSKSMTKSLPQFTSAQNLESIAELRPALVGGLQEATKLAPMFQQAVGVMEAVKQGNGAKALGGVDTHGEALDLVRALEVGGYTSHKGWSEDKIEGNMAGMVNGMTKAIVAMNGQIGAKDFHSAFKFSRGDSVNWSPEFATEILPTLMNELKKSSKTDASQTGNALKSMSRVVMDGVMTPPIAAKWDELGMFAPGAMNKGKGGKLTKNPKWDGGAMLGASDWQSNPFQWMQNYLLPHLKEHGVDLGDRKAVVAAMGGLFGNRVANHIAQILATQQAQIQKDQDNIKKAQGTNGLNYLMSADPTTRMQILGSSLKELSGALGDLALPGVMRGMKGVIDWSHTLADRVGHSSYLKSLGGAFDSAMAGIFGQSLGRKGMNGKNRDYFGAGKLLGGGWSKFTTAIGKMLKFWEQVGLVTGSMKLLGASLDLVGGAMDAVRTGMKGIGDALQSDYVKNLGTDLKAAGTSLVDALSSIASWMKSKFSWAFPAEVDKNAPLKKKLPPMVREGSKLARHINPMTMPELYSGSKGGFGFGGVDNVGSKAIQPITSAVQSATPIFQQAGLSAMSALSNGFSEGGGQAVSSLQNLMLSLSGIASAGVVLPVKLDSAAAEAKLNSLIAKAGSIGSGGGSKAQFSKSLHDNGD